MIPVSLEVTNFLSYRQTAVLNFESIHLAGISGPNGAGKSSIMEAMTWALFGQSRVRSDDDLVNRQAGDSDAAEVRFTFRLENVIYRVIRRKTAGKTVILELQMDAGDGGWKTLSEGKMRETQAAIEDLLQMNYDTFTNASFLLQGKADEFTTRTPGQRKEILAELIGVTQWEQYKERATEARKVVEGRVGIADARLAEIALELEEEPQRQEALNQANAQRQLIFEKKALKEQLLKQTRVKEEARKQQAKILFDAAARSERLQRTLEQTRQKLAGSEDRRQELAAILEHEEDISREYSLWLEADKRAADLQALAQQHNEIVSAMRPFEMAIAQSRSRLEQEKQALQESSGRAQRSQEERRTVVEELRKAEQELAGFQKESEQLDQLQKELRDARQALQQTKGRRDLWQQELAALQNEASRIDGLRADKKVARQDKEQAEELIESTTERIVIIDAQKEAYSQVKAEQQALQAQQPNLRQEMDKLKQRIETLESADLGGACPICEQPLSEDHRHKVVAKLQDDGRHYGDSFRENQARLKALDVEIPQLERTINQGPQLERERQAQQKRLAQAEARLNEIARAEEDWSADGEKRLVKLAAQLADESEFKQNTRRVDELELALREHSSVQQKLQDLQKQIALHNARLVEVERLIGDWEATGRPRLAEVSERLETESFAGSERTKLLDFQARLDELGYDREAHQAALAAREEVASAPRRNQALREAKAALEPLQNAIDNLNEQIAETEKDLTAQKHQQEEAQKQLAILESEGIDLAALEKEVDQLREDEVAAAGTVGAAQQRLDVLDDLRQLRGALLEEKAELTQRVRRLVVLEKSCGRQGVQALLIEHALPEIEEGANALLDRLTGGEMRVKFDTQRQLKSRDATAETLDIVISDRAGERPYDNYSGGEQFRINFAIRLALSQLLANRSGVRLQTLVVDEGFGSQDPQGRQRLIEAINAIQDDFACILVITHVDELREAFPTRIEVQKELSGSTITVY